MSRVKHSYYLLFISFTFIVLIVGCRGRESNSSDLKDTVTEIEFHFDSLLTEDIPDTSAYIAPKPAPIYGDTIYVYPYGTQVWLDTIQKQDWEVFLSVWVDTTDYIIDTVKSIKGNRLVIGYNHYYNLEFRKKKKYWFSLNFNKRDQLRGVLEDTDAWIASNLNVFHSILYNKRYNSFVAELNINARNSVSSLYYLVFNTQGKLNYIGYANSWGGGGPDGESFITANNELYVSCFEVYNFQAGVSMNLNEYASLVEFNSKLKQKVEFQQVHAIRDLGNNRFLVIFNRNHQIPRYNALIMGPDTNLYSRFIYAGLIEDMDAILLYTQNLTTKKRFIFDSEREVLVMIDSGDSLSIREIPLAEMQPTDSLQNIDSTYHVADFGFYSTYQFIYNNADTNIYYNEDGEE